MGKPDSSRPFRERISRRTFLETATVAGASMLSARAAAKREDGELSIPPGARRSRVVHVQSPYVVQGSLVHKVVFREMLEAALKMLTEASTITAAWRTLLQPEDVIGIKFNRSGQERIGTSMAFADVMIGSLRQAGWGADQLVCIEAPSAFGDLHKTLPPKSGYDLRATPFGSGSDQLASWLKQITAIIDVPFLKTHNIAGMTGALKNLSHGLVKHPARYHHTECSPYVADIVALPQIRKKLRLCLVDALRMVYDGGPEATADTISDDGILLAAVDPVAADAVGLLLLNNRRRVHGLLPVADSPAAISHVAAAHRRGLGYAVPTGIDIIRVKP